MLGQVLEGIDRRGNGKALSSLLEDEVVDELGLGHAGGEGNVDVVHGA